jgi:hypothetical protein
MADVSGFLGRHKEEIWEFNAQSFLGFVSFLVFRVKTKNEGETRKKQTLRANSFFHNHSIIWSKFFFSNFFSTCSRKKKEEILPDRFRVHACGKRFVL